MRGSVDALLRALRIAYDDVPEPPPWPEPLAMDAGNAVNTDVRAPHHIL